MQQPSIISGQASFAILEAAAEGILIAEIETKKILYANPSMCAMLGYSSEEIQKLTIRDLHSPEEIRAVSPEFDSLPHGQTRLSFTVSYLRKNGTSFKADVFASRVTIDGVPCNAGFITDITERNRTLEALRLSEEKFSKAFMTSPDSININRLSDGVYLDINNGFTEITGYTREDVIGRSSLPGELGLWVNEEDRDRLVASLKAKGKAIGLESLFRCKDGTVLYGIMSARIIEINGEACILSITRDITEKQKMLLSLQNSQKLEALGVLAGGIAHDFNNLLTGIYGNIDLAVALSKDPKVSDHLKATMNTMNRARSLTHQLLTFAKGGTPVKRIDTLFPFIQDTANFALSGSNVVCNYDIEPSLWPCDYDKNQIGQVIDNIVINAMQSMPLGGEIRISAKNTLVRENGYSSLAPGNYVRISIADKGVGIQKEILPRIFDPFFTTKQKGSGLGLATCYSIVNRHGGSLSVESELGKGSTFHVFLPASNGFVQPREEFSQKARAGCGKILLMDDEEIIRQTAEAMLATLGYSCVSVHDGLEAEHAFVKAQEKGDPFAAVLCDLTVPGGMGGKELARKIRSIDTDVPIIVTSGYADDPIIASPDEFGFTDSLCKPFTTEELGAVLEKSMTRSKKR